MTTEIQAMLAGTVIAVVGYASGALITYLQMRAGRRKVADPPDPHDAYQVTCLGCGAITYHPQSCEAGKLWPSTEQEEEPTGGALPNGGTEVRLQSGEHVWAADLTPHAAGCYCCSVESLGAHCRTCHAKGYCG